MKKKLWILLLFSLHTPLLLAAKKTRKKDPAQVLAEKLADQEIAPHAKRKKKGKKDITFSYTNEEVIDIINALAEQKGVNVFLPQGPDAITTKVTIHLKDKVSFDEAWQMVGTILDFAGYSLFEHGNGYKIVKNEGEFTKEPFPIYIGTEPDDLPDGDTRILYIYYPANVKASAEGESELTKVLTEFLPEGSTNFKIDSRTNAVIIKAKLNDIKAVMRIVKELDRPGFKEKLDIIKLRHSSAEIVAQMFTEHLLKAAAEPSRYRLGTKKQASSSFFEKKTRVIPETRTNSLVLLGRAQAVNRIKDFIIKYIDVELESGKSILHIYQLQYLDAEQFAPTLQNIVKSASGEGSGQARVSRGKAAGTERFFDEIIIKADRPSGDTKYFGGNKLVIACRNDDWKVIKKLIEDLDTPQPQVLIEILIVDLTVEDIKLLGSMLRRPEKVPFYNKAEYQAAHVSGIILDENCDDTPTTLATDLLRKAFDSTGGVGSDFSVASFLTAGSSVISLSDADGKTWGILQLLQTFRHSKILSHPHVIATNNQQALVVIGETRLLRDQSVGTVGTTTVTRKQEPAELRVEITPRISSANVVNIQVTVHIDEYTSSENNSRVTRNLTTNANIKSGDVLALGGLIKVDSSNALSATPLLNRIPIFGYLFKKRNNRANKTNLTVFISPTIIEPRLRGGVGKYTQDYVGVAKTYSQESELFDTLKDPITRLFFSTVQDAEEEIDKFLNKDEFKLTNQLEEKELHLTRSKPAIKERIFATNLKAPLPPKSKKPIKIAASHSRKKRGNLKGLFENEKNPLL